MERSGESRPGGHRTLDEKEPNAFVAVARIVRPQGRRGEVVAEVLTDFASRFEETTDFFLEDPSAPRSVTLESVWPHKGRVVLKLSGVDSIEEAARLRGLSLLIRQEDRAPLAADHYYVSDLKGCRVVREHRGAQIEVGVVTEVESTGGVDLLHVSRPGGRSREALIPLAQAICTRIDPATRTIVIDPPEGLLEL